MKILHVTKKYPPALGGDAVYVAQLEKEQRKLGHDVFIFCANCLEIRNKNDSVFTFGLPCKSRDLDRITFKRVVSLGILAFSALFMLKKIRPDIIHVHSVELGVIISRAAALLRIPVVITCHAVLFPYMKEYRLKAVLDYILFRTSCFSSIITVDASSLDAFRAAGLRNCSFFPVGADVDDFGKAERESPAGKEKIRILFVGRLEKIKGIDLLLRALKTMIDEGYDFKAFLAGEGSCEIELKALAEGLNLGPRVTFLGPLFDRRELIKLYLSADIFVLPSVREWCPIVLFEAWAASLAVIATKTGSIPYIAVDRRDSILIPCLDLPALSGALRDLMRDEGLRQGISRQGRALVEQEYSWKALAGKLEKLYASVICDGRPGAADGR